MKCFASDNFAGVHPDILRAMTRANHAHAPAYGADPWTAEAEEAFRREFGPHARAFFVFLGTGANVLALSTLVRPHQAVICAATAHVSADECGAPERHLGCKLIALPTPDGKLRPEDILPCLRDVGNEHHNQPKAVSITQSTELGTVYTPEEVAALARTARANGLFLHMDGARVANAAASLGLGLADVSAKAGVDVLSFGGTKNGMMYGEAVVFFRPELAGEFRYQRKQGMQLASKMRFISAQFTALLTDGLWRENARKANAMARLLAERVSAVPGVTITQPVQANAVFARVPAAAVPALQERTFFYVWNASDPSHPEVRWMCSFDTAPEEVEAFARALRRELGG